MYYIIYTTTFKSLYDEYAYMQKMVYRKVILYIDLQYCEITLLKITNIINLQAVVLVVFVREIEKRYKELIISNSRK